MNRQAIILIIITFAVLILIGFLKIRNLKSASIASPSGRLNIAFYGEGGVWILAIETKNDQEEIKGIFIPQDVYIETAHGGGEYPISKLENLAELYGNAENFIHLSLERCFKIPIDGIVLADKIKETKDLKKVLTINDLLREKSSLANFNFRDRLIIWRRLRGLVLAKKSIVNLAETRAVQVRTEADGLKTKVVQEKLLPVEIRQRFVESLLAEERIEVVVYNGTDTAGLGEFASGMVENIGLNVVEVTNSKEEVQKCNLRAAPENTVSKSFKRLQQIFKCYQYEQDLSLSSGRIELYLGKDFSQKML